MERGTGFTNGLEMFESQYNSIKNNNVVKFLLAHIKKMQNTTKVETLASNKTVLSSKAAIDKKELDISIENLSCIIS